MWQRLKCRPTQFGDRKHQPMKITKTGWNLLMQAFALATVPVKKD
jgi:hypothetical protein